MDAWSARERCCCCRCCSKMLRIDAGVWNTCVSVFSNKEPESVRAPRLLWAGFDKSACSYCTICTYFLYAKLAKRLRLLLSVVIPWLAYFNNIMCILFFILLLFLWLRVVCLLQTFQQETPNSRWQQSKTFFFCLLALKSLIDISNAFKLNFCSFVFLCDNSARLSFIPK